MVIRIFKPCRKELASHKNVEITLAGLKSSGLIPSGNWLLGGRCPEGGGERMPRIGDPGDDQKGQQQEVLRIFRPCGMGWPCISRLEHVTFGS